MKENSGRVLTDSLKGGKGPAVTLAQITGLAPVSAGGLALFQVIVGIATQIVSLSMLWEFQEQLVQLLQAYFIAMSPQIGLPLTQQRLFMIVATSFLLKSRLSQQRNWPA
jgi:glycerol-3-phosphate acyltransferase PlsY